jgi:RsiW-degrading membrane proteinase PrsW (M82 family)
VRRFESCWGRLFLAWPASAPWALPGAAGPPDPVRGFITGAFIGLGFQISEDILYGFQGASAHFGLNQGTLVGQTLVARGLAGLFSHTMFSAIYCAGLMWLLNRDGSDHRLRGSA